MQLFRKRGLALTARTAVLHTSSLTSAAVVQNSGARPRVLHLDTGERAAVGPSWKAAQQLLRNLPHRETRVSAVMPPGGYHLFLLDAPNVPPAELRDAMRWKLKDMITTAPELLSIDTFLLPQRPNVNGTRQVYVVAAEQWQVDEQAAIVSGGRRLLDNIDIPELALRNLMRLAPGEANGCALLLLGRGYLQILISRNGCLYLARRIEGALARDPGQIALEVQRSLQFHETHFDAPAVGRLLLTPASAAADSLARSLADATGLTVELLPVEQMLDCSGIDLAINEPESIIALGAALRPMQVELN